MNETLTTARSTEFYKTDAGIQQLAAGAYYQVFNVPYKRGMVLLLLLIMERMNFILAEIHPIHHGTIMMQHLIPRLATNGNLQGV